MQIINIIYEKQEDALKDYAQLETLLEWSNWKLIENASSDHTSIFTKKDEYLELDWQNCADLGLNHGVGYFLTLTSISKEMYQESYEYE